MIAPDLVGAPELVVHVYDTTPTSSVDDDPSNVHTHTVPESLTFATHACVNAATGGWLDGGGVLPPMLPTKSRRFGEPVPGLVILPVVASAFIAASTCAGVIAAFVPR